MAIVDLQDHSGDQAVVVTEAHCGHSSTSQQQKGITVGEAGSNFQVKVPDWSETKSRCNPAKTLIVFDWDDTLLCSTFLASCGYSLDSDDIFPTNIQTGLDKLGETILTVLELAFSTCDHVVIITNAETGWVEMSAKKYVPSVCKLLPDPRLTVLSARSTFEDQFPDSPLDWKVAAFRQVIGGAKTVTLPVGVFKQQLQLRDSSREGVVTPSHLSSERNDDFQVVSFGDSNSEREASQMAARDFRIRSKSVKFVERPNMEQLQKELQLLQECFSYVSTHDADLDLMLTISVLY